MVIDMSNGTMLGGCSTHGSDVAPHTLFECLLCRRFQLFHVPVAAHLALRDSSHRHLELVGKEGQRGRAGQGAVSDCAGQKRGKGRGLT